MCAQNSEKDAGNVIPIVLPQSGNSMEEGTIVTWCVGVGDRVKPGDILFEMETDKALVEVEATDAGRVARIVVGEGETAAVKTPVGYLAEKDEEVEAYLDAAAEENVGADEAVETEAAAASQPTQPAADAEAPGGDERIKASPYARKLAAEREKDLTSIPRGSGPGGRIIARDVPAPTAGEVAGEVSRRPLSGMRRAIARNLQASKQTIPHFYMRLTIDAGSLFETYRTEKAIHSVSLNDFILAGCARAMAEFPAFRTRLEEEELVEVSSANIGIAVGMDEGLVVPVLMGAEKKSLREIADQSRKLTEAARQGRVENAGKASMTVSNLGMVGVEEFAAIVKPPEAAILAVGAVREDVIVREGTMRAGRAMTMTLSCDHRIVDGLMAARFLGRLKETLEAPETLIRIDK